MSNHNVKPEKSIKNFFTKWIEKYSNICEVNFIFFISKNTENEKKCSAVIYLGYGFFNRNYIIVIVLNAVQVHTYIKNQSQIMFEQGNKALFKHPNVVCFLGNK